jgi:hypothetical protein
VLGSITPGSMERVLDYAFSLLQRNDLLFACLFVCLFVSFYDYVGRSNSKK